MISFQDLQNLIAQGFFDGDTNIAGIIMFLGAVFAVIGITRNMFYALFAGMVVTFLFTALGILSTDIAVLLIIVSVLGLAYTARGMWSN